MDDDPLNPPYTRSRRPACRVAWEADHSLRLRRMRRWRRVVVPLVLRIKCSTGRTISLVEFLAEQDIENDPPRSSVTTLYPLGW